MNYPIEFSKWLNNNWYEPYGTGNTWRLRTNIIALTPIYQMFTTEELYKKWKWEKRIIND